MFCRKCGTEIAEGSTTCPYCGTQTKNANREYVSAQIDKIKNSDKLNEVKDEVKEKVSSFKKPTKPAIIAIGAALAVLIIVICAVSGSGSVTSKMKKALKENDYQSVQIEYSNAVTDSSKLKKVDKLIADKLNDMIKDIDKFDFKSEAQINDQAIDVWLAQYGTLMSAGKTNPYYNSNDFPFCNCISINNQPLWTELCDRIRSVEDYCKGVAYYNQTDYYSAIESLCRVSQDSGCYSDSQNLIDDSLNLYIDAIIKEADSYMNSGDYETAIKTLDEASSRFKNNEGLMVYIDTINKKMSEVKTKHADSYATKAEESFKKKDAYSAVSNIKFALELSPNNATYQASKAKYEQYLPFELYKEENILKKDDTPFFYNSGTANDNTTHENVIGFNVAATDTDVKFSYTYKLSKKYDTVSGTLFLPNKDKDTTNQSYFVAYADGVKIYTSPYMTAGVLPKDFKFNVSDVDTLTIETYCIKDDFQWFKSNVYISNFVAQKEFK